MTQTLAALSPAIGWGLAVAAVAAGYMGYGWPGVLLALSVIVFWLLLQFSRAVRAMRDASGRPVGRVDNAVMLHARLRTGLRLVDVLKLTRSLGTVVTQQPEVFRWEDDAGDRVDVELQAGRITRWTLLRAVASA
jgi:hypothetical protein